MRLSLATLGLFVLLLTGCGSSDDNEPSAGDVPPPPIEKLLPPDYRVDEVLKANLTGGRVPETVVTSTGPPTSHDGAFPRRPATLQVISWDGEHWKVIFDAQKTIRPKTDNPRTSNSGPGVSRGLGEDPRPLLDPLAETTIEVVDFAPILKGDRDQLLFAATFSYGGSGLPRSLSVVDFENVKAKVLYAWSGEHLDFELQGNRIHARSSFWTRNDAHCCPSRDYRFVVGSSGGSVTVLEDERPYLGALVREQGEYYGEGPLDVLEIAEGSPAAGRVQAGDVLLDIENTPPVEAQGRPILFFDKLAEFDAGQTARLVIRRNGAKLTVPVKLGSLKDAKVMLIPEDEDDRVDAL